LHNRERDDAGSDDDSAAAPDMLDVPPIGPARCDWKCNVFSPDPSWLDRWRKARDALLRSEAEAVELVPQVRFEIDR